MHEFSLVRALLTQVRQIMADHPDDRLQRVSISLGPLSGVEPALVQIAFDQLVDEFDFSDSRLSIIHSTLDACCDQCGQCFSVEGFDFQCPACGSRQVQVTSGHDFRLVDLTIVEAFQAAASEADDP